MSAPTSGPSGRYSFLPNLLRLALPIALQTLMMTALTLADTFMVGQLGEIQIGAIALGNQIFFLLMLFQFGVGSGAMVFASQFWGRGDVDGVRRALGAALTFGAGGAAFFTAAAIAAPDVLLSAFTTDGRLIEAGRPYLRIVSASYVVTAMSMAYTHALRSVGDTRLPMIAAGISIALNVIGNYALIFGVGGLPALGVTGAAIATAVARLVELVIIVGVVYSRRGPVAGRLRQLFDWRSGFLRRFVRRAAPVVANELLWATGFTMYTVVFGRMGTGFLAAYNVADTVSRLLLVIFIATAQASAVLIGNEIGAGRTRDALRIGSTIMTHVPLVALVVGALGFFVAAPLVPELFEISPEVRLIVRDFLRLFSILMLVKTVNLHIIVGILRGGADTTYGLLIDILPLWLIGVPAAMITGLAFGLPAPIVYLALNAEELTRLVLGWRRVRSGRWVHELVENGGIAAPPDDAAPGRAEGPAPAGAGATAAGG